MSTTDPMQQRRLETISSVTPLRKSSLARRSNVIGGGDENGLLDPFVALQCCNGGVLLDELLRSGLQTHQRQV